jgi:hypothetical protein
MAIVKTFKVVIGGTPGVALLNPAEFAPFGSPIEVSKDNTNWKSMAAGPSSPKPGIGQILLHSSDWPGISQGDTVSVRQASPI